MLACGAPPVVLVEIARTRQAVTHLADGVLVPDPEPPDGVAIAPVPLRPAHGEIADLIAALPEIPGLGDELHVRQHGVLMDDVEERAQFVDAAVLARERRGEIEAKPSTCISVTQYRRLSITSLSVCGCSMFRLLPHPV